MKISGVETTGVWEGDWNNDMAEAVKGEMCLDLCHNLFLKSFHHTKVCPNINSITSKIMYILSSFVGIFEKLDW